MNQQRVLEKSKPKKVLYEDVGYDTFHNENLYACICPDCGLHIIEFSDSDVDWSESDEPKKMFRDCMVHHAYMGLNNFCNRCGRKLDWS